MRLLTSSERELIGALNHDPTQATVALAKRLKRKVANVQYQRTKMEQAGLLFIRPAINAFRLGLEQFGVFFSIAGGDAKTITRMKHSILAHPRISWFGSYVGEFHYGLTIQTQGIANLAGILDELEQQLGVKFINRIISPRVRYTYYHRSNLSRNLSVRVATDQFISQSKIEIDALDQSLLSLVASTKYSSVRDLARELGEPSATIDRRYNSLISRGVIAGFIVEVPREALGLETYRVLVETKGEGSDFNVRLEKFMRTNPSTVFLIKSLGQFRYELGIELEQAEQIQNFIAELYSVFGNEIHEVKSLLEITTQMWKFFSGKSTGNKR